MIQNPDMSQESVNYLKEKQKDSNELVGSSSNPFGEPCAQDLNKI